MSTPTRTVQEFMEAFVAAWPERDAAKVASFFSKNAVYHNGPMEAVRGRDAIEVTLAGFMSMGGRVDVDIIHIVAEGAIVMTERVDHVIGTEKTKSLPIMGVFEVHDSAITAWRDYFDPSQFTSQTSDEG
jgi:limonene-1,2-epoxide hydrolase